jgi:hypothetical protein
MVEQETQQEREWEILYDRIDGVVRKFGSESHVRNGDYMLLDENWGLHQHKIEIQNLNMLKSDVIQSLRGLLADFPNWEILVSVDIPGTEMTWPRMGLIIRSDQVVDGLERQYLPAPYQHVTY